MTEYNLVEGLYLLPTPSGAYFSIASNGKDKARNFLRSLLRQSQTPELSVESLAALSGLEDADKALELLHHCQKLAWVQGCDEPIKSPVGALEEILPSLLMQITETGKCLLADEQGFYLVSEGFAHETAEELSALSAEIATVHKRRSGLLRNNLGIASHAWSIVNAYGNSQIGFWPIFIGDHRFVIVIEGVPHFNKMAFVNLIWALTTRYSNDKIG